MHWKTVPAMLAAACAVAVNPMALAQDAATAPAAEPAPRAYSATWSDATIERYAKMLTGSWRSSGAVDEMGGEGEARIWMNIAPAPVEGMTDTLYVELAREDSLDEPFRRSFFQFYRRGDELRIRTLQPVFNDGRQGRVLNWMWAAPEWFPAVSAEDLVGTLDLVLEPASNGFTGATPYPYPTAIGGAVEMTSTIDVSGSKIVSSDRGIAADGSIAWGDSGDAGYTFEKAESPLTKTTRAGGVVTLSYGGDQESVVANQDRLHVQYWGLTTDGNMFDTSTKTGARPLLIPYPPQRYIAGFSTGLTDTALGEHRRILIPSQVGYGENGNPRAGIAGGADLIFDVEILHIDVAQPDENTDDEGGHEGHDHDGHDHG